MGKERKTESALNTPSRAAVFLITLTALFTPILLNSAVKKCDGYELIIKSKNFCASVADDELERSRGLSGVRSLAANEAKLFMFDTPSRYGIWMKDMIIPIDILWLSESKQVLHIEKNVSPSSYPKVFYGGENVKYVLEYAAGSSDAISLVVGEYIYW